MSYTYLIELLLEAKKPHVKDVSRYCLHSLRSEGATVAANNGIKDRLFKRLRRWVRESAKDGYINDE